VVVFNQHSKIDSSIWLWKPQWHPMISASIIGAARFETKIMPMMIGLGIPVILHHIGVLVFFLLS
jgi:hypothetical protein